MPATDWESNTAIAHAGLAWSGVLTGVAIPHSVLGMISIHVRCETDRFVATVDRLDDRRWLVRGGMAYIAAWLVGLAVKPVGVTSAERADVVAGHFLDHRVASVVQVLLVHVAAAAALLIFVVGLSGIAASSLLVREARAFRWMVSGVFATSVAQAVLGVAMITTAGAVEPSSTRALLIGVERLDAVKLVALAGVCGLGVALANRGSLSRWTGRIAAAAIVCLLGAAVALADVVSGLAPMAIPALLLFLVWVGAVAFTVRPTRR